MCSLLRVPLRAENKRKENFTCCRSCRPYPPLSPFPNDTPSSFPPFVVMYRKKKSPARKPPCGLMRWKLLCFSSYPLKKISHHPILGGGRFHNNHSHNTQTTSCCCQLIWQNNPISFTLDSPASFLFNLFVDSVLISCVHYDAVPLHPSYHGS